MAALGAAVGGGAEVVGAGGALAGGDAVAAEATLALVVRGPGE